jgi:hydroxymethylpyrimidine/phosphomethylpyrimidine kinase
MSAGLVPSIEMTMMVRERDDSPEAGGTKSPAASINANPSCRSKRFCIQATIVIMRVALSIAGSDPTGGAGLQSDLQVFRALGVHGAGVVTALTVQDLLKVHEVLPVFPNVVLEQLRKLLPDLRPDAVKIGMLASDDVARMVELGLSDLAHGSGERPPIVLDPVMAASDGTPLLERRALGMLQDIVASATLVTPNLPEAALLTGCDVSTRAGAETAARELVTQLGAAAALIKGGHREEAPDDLFAERSGSGVSLTWLDSEWIDGGPVHGTGCALASAVTAELAKGRSLRESVDAGRRFVAAAIRRAETRSGGGRFLVFPSQS